MGDPESYFPGLVQRFPWIRSRPLFLPCIVGTILSIVILIMVLSFLPESLTKQMRIENKAEQRKTEKRYHELRDLMSKNPDYVPSVDDRYILQLNRGSYFALIQDRNVLLSCIVYGSLCAPLRCRRVRSDPGGTGRSLPHLAHQLPRRPRLRPHLVRPGLALHRREPHADLLDPAALPAADSADDEQAGLVPHGVRLLLPPSDHAARRPGESQQRGGAVARHALLLRLCTVLPLFLRHISCHVSLASFTATNSMVFITNSAYQDFRAKVNGLGQVMSAFGRFLVGLGWGADAKGPSLCSNVFAWSYTNGLGFPFDFGCAFYVGAGGECDVDHSDHHGSEHIAHVSPSRQCESSQAHAA